MEGFWQTPLGIGLIAAFASVLVGAIGLFASPLRHTLDKRFLRYRLIAEYEFDQKRSLRVLIGRYHGRLVHATYEFSNRMQNLYDNEGKGWLNQGGRYKEAGYYFTSFVYRFLRVIALANAFEREAVVIDARIAEPSDGEFLRYCRAMLRTVSDVELFDGLNYSSGFQRDHLFSGTLLSSGRSLIENDLVKDADDFSALLKVGDLSNLEATCRFFDGLNKSEERLRWDRLVALHLVTLGFLKEFGYEVYEPKAQSGKDARRQINHQEVAANLRALLIETGFSVEEAQSLVLEP